MRRTLKKYFIPHHENEYKPHFLRQQSAHFLIFTVIAVFLASFTMQSIAQGSGFISSVLPAVLIDLTNKDRADNNLAILSVNSKLTDAATMKSSDMAQNGYFAHTSPEGLTPWSWLKKAGYQFMYAGENLAIDFTESYQIETAWMNSPGHKANILSPNFKEIGIATVDGMYQGHQTTFVAQMFGSPAEEIVETPAVVKKDPAKAGPTSAPVPKPTASAPALSASDLPPERISILQETPVSVEAKTTDQNLAPTPVVLSEYYPPKVTWFDKFFVNPSILMKIVYTILGIIVLVALTLHIFVEIRYQHLPSVLYGLTVLALMGMCYLFLTHLFGAPVVFV